MQMKKTGKRLTRALVIAGLVVLVLVVINYEQDTKQAQTAFEETVAFLSSRSAFDG